MYAPTRIFYDINTGYVIQVIYGFYDNNLLIYDSVESQINKFKTLSERNKETFDFIEIEYGKYAQDFAESNGYRVNPETKLLEFSYPDLNESGPSEPVFQRPLSEEVESLKGEMVTIQGALDFIIMNY